MACQGLEFTCWIDLPASPPAPNSRQRRHRRPARVTPDDTLFLGRPPFSLDEVLQPSWDFGFQEHLHVQHGLVMFGCRLRLLMTLIGFCKKPRILNLPVRSLGHLLLISAHRSTTFSTTSLRASFSTLGTRSYDRGLLALELRTERSDATIGGSWPY